MYLTSYLLLVCYVIFGKALTSGVRHVIQKLFRIFSRIVNCRNIQVFHLKKIIADIVVPT